MPSRSRWLSAIFALTTATSALAQAEAEGLSASFRKAARRVLPAVVTVRAFRAPVPVPGPIPFVEVIPPQGEGGGGSGVVIDAARGLVLTNDHVIAPEPPPRPLLRRREVILPAPRVIVTLPDGRERPVLEIRRDPRSDLALLTIDPQGLQQADWGESEPLDTGDWVLAVGQPFGLSDTVTAGIVSGKSRGLGLAFYEDLIQTDAAINPGNSGGPLVNLKGEVVGINTAIKSRNGGYEGVGFAVPSARARRVAADLAEFGRVRRSHLGIRIGRLDQGADEALRAAGAVPVTGIVEGGPASRAGLVSGDIIEAIGGKPVRGTGALQSAIESAPVGEPLALTIRRGDQVLELEVRPEAQPDGAEIAPPVLIPRPVPAPAPGIEPPLLDERRAGPAEEPEARSPSRFPAIGLRLSEPNAALVERHGLDPSLKGLIVTGVEPDGPADRAGVEIGMVITDAADRKVATLPEFRTAVARRAVDADLVLRIVKKGKPGFRVLLGRPAAKATTETPQPAPTTESDPTPELAPAADPTPP